MITLFEGETADEVWLRIAEHFRAGSGWRERESRNGRTFELLHAALSVSEPTKRWVVSRTPALNPAFALAEVVWILAGRNDSMFLNAFFPGLPEYQGGGPKYYGAYGHRLRHHFQIDQLERAYRALRGNSDTRQVVLQIWDPAADLPDESGAPRSRDIPCNVLSMLKVRDGKLEWTQIIRSNDLWRGVPHNIVQFTFLQEVVAGWLGLEVGSYNQFSDSLHVYMQEAELARNATVVEPAPNTDSIALGWDESTGEFRELASRVDRLITERPEEKQLIAVVRQPMGTAAMQNILRVLGAELARRRKLGGLPDEIMAECTNPLFRQLWQRWRERNRGAA